MGFVRNLVCLKLEVEMLYTKIPNIFPRKLGTSYVGVTHMPQFKLWVDFEKVAEKTVKEKGSIVTEVRPAEKQKFMDAMKPLYDKQPSEIMAVVNKIRAVK
jgi:hypothetical protein